MSEEHTYSRSILESAIRYARDAGEHILHSMTQPYDMHDKVNLSDLVTAVDLQSESIIRSSIGRDYPEHWIVSEESDGSRDVFDLMKQPAPGYGWIVDPIDGTINFVHGIPHFAISIGVIEDGQLLHGVVYNPCTQELYHATRGEGAYCNGTRLQASGERQIGNAVLATGFPAADWCSDSLNAARIKGVAGTARNIRILGSASLDLCLVASGRLTGFWHDGLYPWDVAAGVLIVREAGGAVTNASGEPFALSDRTLAASNPKLQDALLSLIGCKVES
ncbi:inositol monophosphatase family protein [Paenibacillus protaetiae]|uniref:Inositol-1-monophosphatase n=1 Tax=Paenibacillus protaetiae TaxID=2509456 RepID=A0A4P6EY00_9BACL|nr:inositol monophosphatase family protein [Paenibacillus protaetiae]QAY67565.1 inositol monophosphatase [Paenibacillus protaetiae]